MSVNVIEFKTSARVCFIASDDTRWQKCVVDIDVAKCKVCEGDQSTRFTRLQWVKHAARPVSRVRLLLLLKADVDTPPDRFMDLQILVKDIRNLTAGSRPHCFSMTRIVLNIDSLEGVVERVIRECDITNAIVSIMWDDGANSHSDTEPDVAIAHDNIL